jgi:predicted alpha/beta-fold hydrolase
MMLWNALSHRSAVTLALAIYLSWRMSGIKIMLIVCTKDCTNPVAGWKKSTTWGRVYVLPAGYDQANADSQLRRYLAELKAHEPLCIVAYGFETSLGDPKLMENAWSWSAKDFANLLLSAGTVGHWAVPDDSEESSPVLFHLISTSQTGFTTQLAHAVLDAKTSNFGLSLYSYIDPVAIDTPLPGPYQLKFKVLPKDMTNLVIARI